MIKNEEKPECKEQVCPKCGIHGDAVLVSINKDGVKNYRCLKCNEWWEIEPPRQQELSNPKYKYDWSKVDIS